MELIKAASLVIEFLAVAIIVGMVGYSTVRYFVFLLTTRSAPATNYRDYKHALGKALLLGLEILVAADVIRTVALEPTFENIAGLGLLVVVKDLLELVPGRRDRRPLALAARTRRAQNGGPAE